MRLSFRLKHHFFSAFREFFVHHHGSLEFRAKIFALIIASNEDSDVQSYIIVKQLALNIYQKDEERANLLMLTTKEKVQQVRNNNGLDIDTLVLTIQRDIKVVPRYAKKIDLDALGELILLTHNEEISCYQANIVEFLENLKNETLNLKKEQIQKDEKEFNSQFGNL